MECVKNPFFDSNQAGVICLIVCRPDEVFVSPIAAMRFKQSLKPPILPLPFPNPSLVPEVFAEYERQFQETTKRLDELEKNLMETKGICRSNKRGLDKLAGQQKDIVKRMGMAEKINESEETATEAYTQASTNKEAVKKMKPLVGLLPLQGAAFCEMKRVVDKSQQDQEALSQKITNVEGTLGKATNYYNGTLGSMLQRLESLERAEKEKLEKEKEAEERRKVLEAERLKEREEQEQRMRDKAEEERREQEYRESYLGRFMSFF